MVNSRVCFLFVSFAGDFRLFEFIYPVADSVFCQHHAPTVEESSVFLIGSRVPLPVVWVTVGNNPA